jgi:nucleoside-diphosphate-sugar epimerase
MFGVTAAPWQTIPIVMGAVSDPLSIGLIAGLASPGGNTSREGCPHGLKADGHAWAYLPDVAETFALLPEHEQSLDAFATYHFEGHWDADGTAMTSAIARAVRRPDLKVKRLPWGLLRLIAPFNETVRELLEMKIFWRQSVRLDNQEQLDLLKKEPRTPLAEAVATTLRGIGAS